MKKESNLEDLKKDYLSIQKKYNLPEFSDMNKDFHIEKACEAETDYLIREVRRFIADKFSNYLRFIETILNPVNAPMSIFSIIKTINAEEKKKLTEIYKDLIKSEVRVIELDIEFSEEKEADFIREVYELWQKIKKDLLDVIDVIKKNWDNKLDVNGKGYFG
jgi:hypothetical protein